MNIHFIGQKGIPTINGGVDRHVDNLAVVLASKGHKVYVYNRSNYLPEKISEWKGVNLVYLPYINNKNLAAITHGFLATLKAVRRKPDVIHYHGIGPALLTWIPRLLSPKTKVISTLHSFDYGNDKWGPFAKFMLRFGEKLMCKYSHEVIVLTDLMRDYLLQRYGCKSTIIPNGAKAEKNLETDKLIAFGIEAKKYIITVSRLIKLKGIQYLIQAFKKIPEIKLKLAIVGDGEYMKDLEKMAEDDKRIVFTGNQKGDILNQLYSNAKLFIQSSEMEGQSISLLEAMAHGLPCLVSNIVANQNAATDTALYFETKNEKDLGNKLKRMLENEEEMERLAGKAKKRAEDFFNWNTIADETLKVYQK